MHMTDFYGIGPRNKRLGYRKSEHMLLLSVRQTSGLWREEISYKR